MDSDVENGNSSSTEPTSSPAHIKKTLNCSRTVQCRQVVNPPMVRLEDPFVTTYMGLDHGSNISSSGSVGSHSWHENSDSEEANNFDDPHNTGNVTEEREDSWYPFKSRLHCQLVLLYHGSHRKNVDLVTFRAFISILKVWVPADEYMPSISEVVDFSIPFWENKLFKEEEVGGNIFCYLEPAGLVALRLGNPRHSSSFDRVPRISFGEQDVRGVSSQSSVSKFNSMSFNKLFNFLIGDLIPLGLGSPRGADHVQYFFHIKRFVIQEKKYFAIGELYLHSSDDLLIHHFDTLER